CGAAVGCPTCRGTPGAGADARGAEVGVHGGKPRRESMAPYGRSVRKPRADLPEAVEDFRAGGAGTVPAVHGM
ncbi:pirin, partial [Streptomyces albidoflavus]